MWNLQVGEGRGERESRRLVPGGRRAPGRRRWSGGRLAIGHACAGAADHAAARHARPRLAPPRGLRSARRHAPALPARRRRRARVCRPARPREQGLDWNEAAGAASAAAPTRCGSTTRSARACSHCSPRRRTASPTRRRSCGGRCARRCSTMTLQRGNTRAEICHRAALLPFTPTTRCSGRCSTSAMATRSLVAGCGGAAAGRRREGPRHSTSSGRPRTTRAPAGRPRRRTHAHSRGVRLAVSGRRTRIRDRWARPHDAVSWRARAAPVDRVRGRDAGRTHVPLLARVPPRCGAPPPRRNRTALLTRGGRRRLERDQLLTLLGQFGRVEKLTFNGARGTVSCASRRTTRRRRRCGRSTAPRCSEAQWS